MPVQRQLSQKEPLAISLATGEPIALNDWCPACNHEGIAIHRLVAANLFAFQESTNLRLKFLNSRLRFFYSITKLGSNGTKNAY
jgi:hypothetical protein